MTAESEKRDGHSPGLGNRPLTRRDVVLIWLLVGITLVFSAASAVVALRWLL